MVNDVNRLHERLVASGLAFAFSRYINMPSWINMRQRIIPHIGIEVQGLRIVQLGVRTGSALALQSGDMNRPMLLV